MNNHRLFSDQLKEWIENKQPKTMGDLTSVFGKKSFSVALLLLMFIPALPLPTGGVTHLFEIIAMLVSAEMALGRQTIWLPSRWLKTDISDISQRKTITKLISKLIWLEKHSRPRLKRLLNNALFLRATGVILLTFCLTAFLAPPFSGLDTLPSLAVVFIALALLFEDIYLFVTGLVLGAVGIGTVLVLGTLLFKSFKFLF